MSLEIKVPNINQENLKLAAESHSNFIEEILEKFEKEGEIFLYGFKHLGESNLYDNLITKRLSGNHNYSKESYYCSDTKNLKIHLKKN